MLHGENGTYQCMLAIREQLMRKFGTAIDDDVIEKITVYDDHLAFEFKSGLETEVQM